MHLEMAEHEPLELGEGPRWDAEHGRLLLVDIVGGRILWRADGRTEFETTTVDGHVGALAPVAGDAGRVLAAVDDGVGLVDLATGAIDWLARPERARHGQVRMNDGACDPQGRFVVGSMSYDEEDGAGRLWRIDGAGRVDLLLERCTVPNGLAWSDDGSHLFHADSGPGTITRYRYGDAGLDDAYVLYRSGDGEPVPDGMCMDAAGHLWVAFWGGSCVRQMTVDGRVLRAVAVPMRLSSACWFVGRRMDRLLVTSARVGLDAPTDVDGRSALIDVGEDLTGRGATPFVAQTPAG